MSTCDCVSSSSPTSFFSVANYGSSIKNGALLIKIPLSQSSGIVRLQLSGTLLSKSCFAGTCFKSPSNGGNGTPSYSKLSARNSDELDIYRELGLREIDKNREIRQFGDSPMIQKQQAEDLRDTSVSDSEVEFHGRRSSCGKGCSSSDFLEELDINGTESVGKSKEDNLVKIQEGLEVGKRSGRQMMKRSNIIAKQVISIQSAFNLGYVSQLWVDTNSWLVLIIEVRPSLLYGEPERCLLEDITKVGDVLLVEDEHVMDNDFKLVGLETLVGYAVVTPGRRNIGKVRGYTFNINSGAVESLELDSFGISIIPSSLVSTYALFVEDVLEVLPDTVVVHEAAASRIQRLTKGFWGTQNIGDSVGEVEEYFHDGVREDGQSGHRRSKNRKVKKKIVEYSDELELPMDFL